MGTPQNVAGYRQDFLRGGLAGAAGDGDDAGIAAGPRGAGQVFQTALGMGHGQQRKGLHVRHIVGAMGDQRRAGLGVESRFYKGMTITAFPFQRHEQIARPDGAGVNGKTAHGEGRAGPAQSRGLGFAGCPQRHAARPPRAMASFTACSRSEKG